LLQAKERELNKLQLEIIMLNRARGIWSKSCSFMTLSRRRKEDELGERGCRVLGHEKKST